MSLISENAGHAPLARRGPAIALGALALTLGLLLFGLIMSPPAIPTAAAELLGCAACHD